MSAEPRKELRPIASALRALSLAVMLAGAGLAAGWTADRAAAQEAGGGVIDADEALRLTRSGELILIDVRSRQEWRQTGVPAGARTVTIHNPNGLVGFLEEIRRELAGEFDRPIAVICAQGNRSTLAQSALSQAGYSRVLNVREGMFGSAHGPGWLARGLPTDACDKC